MILPGSKATLADLGFLRREGWDIDILAHRRAGGQFSACAAATRCSAGASPIRTGAKVARRGGRGSGCSTSIRCLAGDKRLCEAAGTELATGMTVARLRDASWRTTGPGLARPMLDLGGRPDGCGQPRRTGRRLLSARAVRRRCVPPRLPRPARRRSRATSPTSDDRGDPRPARRSSRTASRYRRAARRLARA